MINILKKKLSLLFIVSFVLFSIKNLVEFNDFAMLDVSDEDVLLDIAVNNQNLLDYDQEEFLIWNLDFSLTINL